MKKDTIQAIKTTTLALSLGLSISCTAALATKLVAQPLPRERQDKDFSQAQTIITPPSYFQRRPDYRESEREKRQAEEAARQANEQAKQKAQFEQLESLKKRQQFAIEANNQAVALGKQGRWAEALEAHETAVRYDSQNKQFRINLSAARTHFGQNELATGDADSATSSFRKALAAAPDNGLAGRLLCEAMKRQGHDPASPDIRLKIGDQLAAMGDYEGSLVEFQAALQLESSARTYVKMGDMAIHFGQINTATNWYRQAIVKSPDCGAAHRQLGLMALMQKDYTTSAASLRKAVILDPKDTAAGQALIDIWRRQVATNPLLAENHLGLAGALQLTGDFASAEDEYRKLEALDPKNPSLEPGRQSLAKSIQHARADKHRLAAETLFNQSLRREALAEISQAVMLEPRNAKFQFLLAECLEANGDYQGAHRAYLTCVLIDPENNKEAASRMRQMQVSPKVPSGVTPLAQDTRDIRQTFIQGNPELNLPQKNMYEGRQSNEPPVSLQPTVSGQPTSTESKKASTVDHNLLAQVTNAEAQKDYTSAISLLRQLLTSALQSAEVHHRLAVDLLTVGEITEALSEFRIASALEPTKKPYSDDLAMALSIHKRSVVSNSRATRGPDTNGQVEEASK